MATDPTTPSVSNGLDRYIKLNSLTWWTSVVTLVAGFVLMVAQFVPGLESIVSFVQGFYPGASAMVLITAGLAGIGIRGAMDTAGSAHVDTVADAAGAAAAKAVTNQPVA